MSEVKNLLLKDTYSLIGLAQSSFMTQKIFGHNFAAAIGLVRL